MLVSPDKPLCFGGRGSHIHLFLTDFVLILFLPTIGLCRLKLGSGEATFLTVFHAEIFLLGLVLPLALLVQWAHRQQNVGVGIVTVCIVDGSVSTHSIGHKLLPDKVLQQLDLLLPV